CQAGSEEGCTGEALCQAGCQEGGCTRRDQGCGESTGGCSCRCRKVGSPGCTGAGNAVDGSDAGYQVVAESGRRMALPDGFAPVLIASSASSKATSRLLSPCRFFLAQVSMLIPCNEASLDRSLVNQEDARVVA
ncbi:MAG: hypothetical protein RBS46_12010, partial [Methyloversatilis sp.]|nr:hypothetical protein [Methyloversatilis sp.]